MIGQISSTEFDAICKRGKIVNADSNSFIIQHGKTINWWISHEDNSWTNTHCKTIY